MNHLTTEAQQPQEICPLEQAAMHFITHCKTDQPLWAASRLKDLHRTEDETRTLMMELYNPRCANPSSDETEQAITATYNAQSVTPLHVTNSVTGIDPFNVTMGIGYDKSDQTANACRFIQEHYPAGTLRARDGLYYWYEGSRWVTAEPEAMKRGVFIAAANSGMNDSGVKGTLAAVYNSTLRPEALDTYNGETRPELVNVANGILNAKTGELLPHSKDFFTTHCMDYAYNPNAKAPRFMQFLQEATGGDQQFIECLQVLIGQVISGAYVQQFPIIVGRGGTGKSVFENVLKLILGEHNSTSLSIADLAKQFGLEPAIGKRLITFSDERNSAAGFRDGLTSVLKLTGGNEVLAHRKNKTSVKLGRTSLLYISNELPRFTDSSGAVDRRIVIYPFDNVAPTRDAELFNKLRAEAEGILLWAVEGVKKFYANGSKLIEPQCAADKRDDVLEMANPLLQFVDEVCEIGTDNRTSQTSLYTAYTAWCIRENERPLGKRSFKEHFLATCSTARFAKSVRVDDKVVRGFIGVKPRDFMETGAAPARLSAVTG